MRFTSVVLFLCLLNVGFAQKTQAFQIYNKKGKKVSFEKMVKSLESGDVILFGEFHNDPIAHWLQLKLTKALAANNDIALGAEMFEADNQKELSMYLKGEIDHLAFDSLARLWSNYKTDYKPLVDFAKENDIDFVATNVPRRYASMVFKKGVESLDELPKEELEWIAPLPFPYDPELPGYKNMLEMMRGRHTGDNFPKAQAIKDATMAHFIVQHIEKHAFKFLHFHGTYHSNNFEGIFWYLNEYKPELNVKTIATVSQVDVNKLLEESKGLADFILVVDEDMTKTH